MLWKIVGLILMIFGGLTLRYFPGLSDNQPKGMTLTGIFIGIICFVLGLALLIFG